MINYLNVKHIVYPINTNIVEVNYSQPIDCDYVIATCFAYGSFANNGLGNVITATYAGIPMPKIYQEISSQWFGIITACFCLYNLPAYEGSKLVIFNFGSTYSQAIGTVCGFSGVNKQLITQYSTGTGTNNLSLNLATGDLLISSLGVSYSGNFELGAGQNEIFKYDTPGTLQIIQSYKIGNGNMTANFNTTSYAIGGAVPINNRIIGPRRFPIVNGKLFC